MNLKEELKIMEKKFILDAYTTYHNNQSQTARALGISRTALIYKLRNYGVLTNKEK